MDWAGLEAPWWGFLTIPVAASGADVVKELRLDGLLDGLHDHRLLVKFRGKGLLIEFEEVVELLIQFEFALEFHHRRRRGFGRKIVATRHGQVRRRRSEEDVVGGHLRMVFRGNGKAGEQVHKIFEHVGVHHSKVFVQVVFVVGLEDIGERPHR